MRAFSLSAGEKNGQEVEAVQRILNISMSEAGAAGNEVSSVVLVCFNLNSHYFQPIPHHLMAVLHSMQNRSVLAESKFNNILF